MIARILGKTAAGVSVDNTLFDLLILRKNSVSFKVGPDILASTGAITTSEKHFPLSLCLWDSVSLDVMKYETHNMHGVVFKLPLLESWPWVKF